jgi:hypothetical protein
MEKAAGNLITLGSIADNSIFNRAAMRKHAHQEDVNEREKLIAPHLRRCLYWFDNFAPLAALPAYLPSQ